MEKINRIWNVRLSKVLLAISLVGLFPFVAQAQGIEVVRGDCTPDLTDGGALTRGARRQLPKMRQDWDASRVYKQMVILVSFRDVTFQAEHPQEVFNSFFNQSGYNQRNGVGCVADYFREQSGGLFNIEFDVYGPVIVDTLACPYNNPTSKTRNYGKEQFQAATRQVLDENPDVDYSQYDWNGDGQIEQVVYVFAGLCGNQGDGSYGYIWPNSGSFATVTAPGNLKISNFTAIPGEGAEAVYMSESYYVGKQSPEVSPEARKWLEEGKTVVYFHDHQSLLAAFAVEDELNESAASAVSYLRDMKVQTYMLTGDNSAAARLVARQVGVDQVTAEVLPQDKEQFVRRLQENNRKVAMVGDGINDSAALARANLSVAMGKGSDIAMEASMVTIVASDLSKIPQLVDLSRRTVRIIRENLVWAFLYNVIAIPAAAGLFGFSLTPMIAAACMAFSSVCVVCNSLRLR